MSGRLIGGRYEILRKIAEGGMGAVYEARHHLSQKHVALKVLHPHIGRDDNARQRFVREVSAPAQIGHDGIVEVLDAGFDGQDGSLFVAMELLRGDTLRERLARGGLTRDQVLDWFEAMLDALAAAHAKGIVHRDLKPENVFLHQTRDGRIVVKLLDFGIARDLDARSQSVTQTGTAMGTAHYMAPEQAMSARGVGPPADVWAVGAMLYEALSGRTPFTGETPSAIVVRACTQPHQPLGHVAPSTPHVLAALVDRCLSKEPEKRPLDAGQLLAELRAARSAAAAGSTRALDPIAAAAARVTPASASFAGRPTAGSSPGVAPPVVAPASYAGSGAPPITPQITGASAIGTPPPTVSPVSRGGSGMLGRVLVIGGIVAVLGLVGTVGVVFVGGALFAGETLLERGGQGTVRVMTTVPGRLFVDGTDSGPAMIGGQDLVVSAGDHTIEIRDGAGAACSGSVHVAAGSTAQLELVRGVFASSAGGGSRGGLPQTITGALAPGDQRLHTGEYMDYYEVPLSAGQRVHVELTSPAFDTYLIVRYPSGAQRDNDDARGTDSMLDLALDETGVYRVLATSYRAGETGPYTLTIR